MNKFFEKAKALFRYLFYLSVSRKINFSKLVFIGSNCKLGVKRKGLITFAGKARLSDYSEVRSNGGVIDIGNKVSINKYSRIVSREKILLGNNIKIAQFVSILDHDHTITYDGKTLDLFNGYNTAPIEIGDNVWISDKVTILKGVKIGSNVIVAANSVVTKDIPSNTIYGGIPSKLIKKLDD